MRSAPAVGPLLAAVMLAATLVGGCSSSERVCSQGSFPVLVLDEDGRLQGGGCVADGEPLPAGSLRYLEDLEPTLQRDQERAQERFQERLDARR